MKKIFIFLFALWGKVAYAGWQSITCIEGGGVVSTTIEFDDSVQKVRVDGYKIAPAVINPSVIYFEVDISQVKYSHHINRQSGVLIIRNMKFNRALPPFNCASGKSKF